MTDEEITFPRWGFWINGRGYDAMNRTDTRHLFLSESKVACGFDPSTPKWRLYYRFSEEPKVLGLLDTMSEVYRGKKFTKDEFKKCKKCLKYEEKKNE